MTDCIFCKIVEGKIPAAKIYEDDNVISFLDIMPANKGHCLIITKHHHEHLLTLKENELNAVMQAAQKVANAVSVALGCEGYNLVMNNGKIAGQVVMHTHMHVIPRFSNDGHHIKWEHAKYDGTEMQEYAAKIKKCIE